MLKHVSSWAVVLCLFFNGAHCEEQCSGETCKAPGSPEEEMNLIQVLMQPCSRRAAQVVEGQEASLAEEHSGTTLQNAAADLTQSCLSSADKASCDHAASLANALSGLSSNAEDPIADAAEKVFLRTWFANPGGTGGYFNFLDKDHNHKLDKDELKAEGIASLFEMLDNDKDGSASREECQSFLRASAVLFKKLPTKDKLLAQIPLSAMLNDADRVTLPHVAATGPRTNPLAQAASELQEQCPEPAEKLSCNKAADLARVLAKATNDTPPQDVAVQACDMLGLYYWFSPPDGPKGLFKALDREQKGSHTAADLDALAESAGLPRNPSTPMLFEFADSNKDQRVDRKECRDYLSACALLLHKLPALDPATAFKPLPEVISIANSVLKE